MLKPASSLFPILWLNPTERDRVELAIVTPDKTVLLERDVRAQALPALIPELLTKAGLALTDVKTLAVANKPGSLTGTRIGVTVANTLGWLNGWPIIELNSCSLKAASEELRTKKIRSSRVAAVQDEVVYS